MPAHSDIHHEPVMAAEVVTWLAVRPGGAYVDCTLGDAGHATAILEASAPDGRVLGLDADPEALPPATERLRRFGDRAVVVNANFGTVASQASAYGFVPADGVLFDLGLSSRQLDVEERGFSFRRSAPLDMRFMPEGPSAAELVNGLPEQELADLIYTLGEEPRSRRIARAIVAARPLTDTAELAEVVARASGYRRGRTHPATRTFQALRMATNDELGNLRRGLSQAASVLDVGGRLVTIAYHSLEDREVKRFVGSGAVRPLTKRVIKPGPEEVARNRRSRSARMRVAENAGSSEGDR
ncbi:MAG: 16S rRNA (cytosine(1402)-N(4))-methyltransferase RsmH [Chloroflexota bacterium]|nr:16S rRNA (cytosine(1402)-N(4))-methyltransferase RsmH [Chloroflexota bacterium]MDE2884929.1 16S rRNA (cytosine(1402)-N(4))-methyltransferase RsmH [Chloroflexota bacterium]